MEWLVHLVIRLAQSVTSDCLISPGKTNRFWDRDLCVLARHTIAVNLFLIPNHYPRVLSGSIQWMLDMWIFGWCSFSSKINFVCKWFVCNFNNKFVYSHRCLFRRVHCSIYEKRCLCCDLISDNIRVPVLCKRRKYGQHDQCAQISLVYTICLYLTKRKRKNIWRWIFIFAAWFVPRMVVFRIILTFIRVLYQYLIIANSCFKLRTSS
jgi:hypothetical protein